MNVYKVVKGDTLESIAKRYKLSVIELSLTNNLKAVCPGMRLLIPLRKGIPYTVQPHDNMESIASKFNVDVGQLCELNNTVRVFLGQLIFVPEKDKIG